MSKTPWEQQNVKTATPQQPDQLYQQKLKLAKSYKEKNHGEKAADIYRGLVVELQNKPGKNKEDNLILMSSCLELANLLNKKKAPEISEPDRHELYGYDLKNHLTEKVILYRLAASVNEPEGNVERREAMFLYAQCHENGEVKSDNKKKLAAMFYIAAAKSGHAAAQCKAAALYHEGQYVDRDLSFNQRLPISLDFNIKAAAQGQFGSIVFLAKYCLNLASKDKEDVSKKDYKKYAAVLYREAAEMSKRGDNSINPEADTMFKKLGLMQLNEMMSSVMGNGSKAADLEKNSTELYNVKTVLDKLKLDVEKMKLDLEKPGKAVETGNAIQLQPAKPRSKL